MIAIPSLDLSGATAGSGSTDGRARRMTAPASAARELADIGFARLNVADAHEGDVSNLALLEDIVRDTSARVQVSGLKTTTDIDQLLRAGAECIAVGERAIDEPEWLDDVAELYPDLIGLMTDVRDRRVVRRGWVRTLPVDILDLVDELNALPLRELIVTVPTLDGGIRFNELALLEDVADHSRCPVLVAGGVGSIHDLRALEHRGIAGVMMGAERLLGSPADAQDIAREFGA
ncbi:MAG: HisA/HisF-related TIM barrel protein [Gemmatimonadaceae bacterium]